MYCQKQHDPGNSGWQNFYSITTYVWNYHSGAKFYGHQVNTAKVLNSAEVPKPPTATLNKGRPLRQKMLSAGVEFVCKVVMQCK